MEKKWAVTCFTTSYRSDCVRQLESHCMAAVTTAFSASLRLCKQRRAAEVGWLVMTVAVAVAGLES